MTEASFQEFDQLEQLSVALIFHETEHVRYPTIKFTFKCLLYKLLNKGGKKNHSLSFLEPVPAACLWS